MDKKLVDDLARALYETRHPPGKWPDWDDLLLRKTYKRVKYRQLAETAIRFMASRR